MKQNLFKILKDLKEIQPEADFSHKSKVLLMSQIGTANEKPNFFYNKLFLAVSSAVVLVLIFFGGVFYISRQSNQSDLVAKASEANASIQVKLNEIQYLIKNSEHQLDSGQIVAMSALLQRAADDLKAAVSSNAQDLGQSLEKIKMVQEMLYQLDISAEK